mgnify:CR=1 FL=1
MGKRILPDRKQTSTECCARWREKNEEYERVRHKKYREEHKEEIAAKQKEYNLRRSPESRLASWYRLRYDLSFEDYNVILEAQGGGCAICGARVGDSLRRRLVVDHNHGTGKVRGLLCGRCNMAIGLFLDDKELLVAAVGYLSNA